MGDLTEIAFRFIRLYGPLALAIFAFLETSMLFPFLPSEVVVPGTAALLITDLMSLSVFTIAAGAGGTIGAFVPFYAFQRTRNIESNWLRQYITVSDEHIDKGENWFQKWGESSVLWGRFLPGLRSVVSIPAGFVQMSSTRFGTFTAVGTTAFYAATGSVVYYGRQQSLFTTAVTLATDQPSLTVISILVLSGIGLFMVRVSIGIHD